MSKATSKGSRRSSISAGRKHKQSAITIPGRINTNMRDAFERVTYTKETASVAARIFNCLQSKAGTVAVGRGYSCSLKYRTRQALQAQGYPI